jgi:superfamily II DNA or RNA helicase
MDRTPPPENLVTTAAELIPGHRVTHPDFGAGVIVDQPHDGYVRVFFAGGERQVPLPSLQAETSNVDRVLANVAGTPERLRRVWLSYEAHALPLMESAAALTAAKVDLLPHQVVLTHRIATASPRRFLVADEVGLGKTIETALILREMASRGELTRALMVVPAGLVNNWHRELNEVFNLRFEVFGTEGDVTDRKTNAFTKHNRLIASIDTLKRPARVKRLLEAPPWDLVVFDEAHHLTAYQTGTKVHKTANYRLAEVLKNHSRDLLLLSATPHQGDHFRFWMLIQLLNPTLFRSPEEMVAQRHRLNSVIFRRTKADACRPDGSALFARRWVHTESFLMSASERTFYEDLRAYLEDGFALARRRGNEGRGLGFVMAIFQKIAASSFAAVRRTLRRRLLALTLHEALLKDRDLDLEGRQTLLDEARTIIREDLGLHDDIIGRAEVDRVLADLRLRLVKQIDHEELGLAAGAYADEAIAEKAEDVAATAVTSALPEERQRLKNLLARVPPGRETKIEKLLRALGALWQQTPGERVVVFATYLGTVDLLAREIEAAYPGQGVVVLRGGDHGAKLAAERRFAQPNGPKVLVCTAAGREGINLQIARVLFNFDLPWNPMDVEQRIGRIHRYGQQHTAQVYNLVLSDTIEGRIFLLLNDKLLEIAKALGKVDEQGFVAEDFHAQILGQLSERLSYDRLYQEALSDPELRRTRLEVEAALGNASEARRVVFELFQDLDRFSLDEYKPFADVTGGLDRLTRFLAKAVQENGLSLVPVGADVLELRDQRAGTVLRFTTARDKARQEEDLDLLGLDHPVVEEALTRWRALPPEECGVSLASTGGETGVLAVWLVESQAAASHQSLALRPLAVSLDGERLPAWERRIDDFLAGTTTLPRLSPDDRQRLFQSSLEPMIDREIRHRYLSAETASYKRQLLAWIEVT